MIKIDERNKKKFYDVVMEFHSQGLSYTESVCKVIEILELKYIEAVHLMDSGLKEEIKREGIDKHLLKMKKENDLGFLFKEK